MDTNKDKEKIANLLLIETIHYIIHIYDPSKKRYKDETIIWLDNKLENNDIPILINSKISLMWKWIKKNYHDYIEARYLLSSFFNGLYRAALIHFGRNIIKNPKLENHIHIFLTKQYTLSLERNQLYKIKDIDQRYLKLNDFDQKYNDLRLKFFSFLYEHVHSFSNHISFNCLSSDDIDIYTTKVELNEYDSLMLS